MEKPNEPIRKLSQLLKTVKCHKTGNPEIRVIMPILQNNLEASELVATWAPPLATLLLCALECLKRASCQYLMCAQEL